MSNFGVDLLLESQKANIKNKNDILIIVMHWMLCKNNLRNVGIGDNVSLISDLTLLLCSYWISLEHRNLAESSLKSVSNHNNILS